MENKDGNDCRISVVEGGRSMREKIDCGGGVRPQAEVRLGY